MKTAPPTPASTPDPRLHAVRRDLADARLQGRVAAERFVAGQAAHCRVAATPLLCAPDAAATQVSELLHGEAVTVFEVAGSWAWVQCAHDGYVGYAAATALGDGAAGAPTHRVVAAATHLYPQPSVKARPLMPLYAGTALAVDTDRRDGGFVAAGAGWVAAAHVAPLGAPRADPVAAAERLLGAPYLWGGRSVRGVDCSGLVQVALMLCGRECPRDTDMQQAQLGREIGTASRLRRGDLVFFPGHVGLMVDAQRLIHANATHMAVTVDPLEDVAAIVERRQRPAVTARRRLQP